MGWAWNAPHGHAQPVIGSVSRQPPYGCASQAALASGASKVGTSKVAWALAGVAALVVVAVMACGLVWWRARGTQLSDRGGVVTRPDGRMVMGARAPMTVPTKRWTQMLPECKHETACHTLPSNLATLIAVAKPGAGADLLALDHATGAIRWRAALDVRPDTVQDVDGNVVLADRSKNGTNKVVAIDPATGAQRWALDGLLSDYYHHGLLFLLGRGDKGTVRAVLAATGDVKWQGPVGVYGICDGVFFAPNTDRQLVIALRAETGEEIWRKDLGPVQRAISGNPDVITTCGGPTVYVRVNNELRAYSGADGGDRWTVPAEEGSAPRWVPGHVALMGRGTTSLFADPDGRLEWSVQADDPGDVNVGVRQVEGGLFVSGRRLHVRSQADGRILGHLDVPSSIGNGQVWTTAQGVYEAKGDRVIARDLKSLGVVWELPTPANHLSMGGDQLYTMAGGVLTAWK